MDDDQNPHGYGSLGGVGIDSHDKARSKVVAEGIEFVVPCGGCGKEIGLIAEWPEVFMMSKELAPQQWAYEPSQGGFMPLMACRCGSRLRIVTTPDECNRNLRSGMSNRAIDPNRVAQWEQQLAARGR